MGGCGSGGAVRPQRSGQLKKGRERLFCRVAARRRGAAPGEGKRVAVCFALSYEEVRRAREL